MDPRHCAQDVVRCSLCKDAVGPMYCEVCHIHLCEECVGKHLSDKSKVHKVLSLTQFLSTFNNPNCQDHPTKQCELHCKHCDFPICTSCISSGKHLGHKAVDIFEALENRREVLTQDLEELEKVILPKYQEAAVIILTEKDDQCKTTQKLTLDLKKQEEALYKEINDIVQSKQTEINEMDSKHKRALDKEETEINRTISAIKQAIQDLKSLLNARDVTPVFKYQSLTLEFRKLPPKLSISSPNFQPYPINRVQLLKQFGNLTPLIIKTEEQSYTESSPGNDSCPPARPLLDDPRLITELNTGYEDVYHVACLSDEEIWTNDDSKIIKLYNLKGKLIKSVQTKSGNEPSDIAVTRSGDLVYTDPWDGSINRVSGTQIQQRFKLLGMKSNTKIETLITPKGWRPHGVSSTSSGDLLVIMDSNDEKEAKVVRYSGSVEKESIQYDDQGEPLYTSGGLTNKRSLSENKNLDICVADLGARAVTVVSAAGKLRFRYTGRPSTTWKPFEPLGIITDSQGNILISDGSNQCIHIIDKDCHFLHYIDSCDLQLPRGICVDFSDNLFVAELGTGKVKKIQYYK